VTTAPDLMTSANAQPPSSVCARASAWSMARPIGVGVHLVVSWIVAVVFTPLLGVTILPAALKRHHEKKGRFAQLFSRLLIVCLHHRWITIGATAAAFVLALFGMTFVQQQFFPSSDRSELVIDWNLPRLDRGHQCADRPLRA
jgi:multidrug efflux pump